MRCKTYRPGGEWDNEDLSLFRFDTFIGELWDGRVGGHDGVQDSMRQATVVRVWEARTDVEITS